MSSTNNNVIMSVLKNKMLLRHMFSLIREEYDNQCPAVDDDCLTNSRHLYKHFVNSLAIMDKGWYSLMADRIKKGDSLYFSSSIAVELCGRVTDADIFTTVYNAKRFYFTDPECLKTAITKGNINAVRILLDQHKPVNLSNHFTFDTLMLFTLTTSQYHIAEFLIDKFHTHDPQATTQNILDHYIKRFNILHSVTFYNMFVNLQTVPYPEKFLQTYKPHLREKSSVGMYLSDFFFIHTNTPIKQWLLPLYSYCKVNGLVEDVQQFKSECDKLLQQSIDNSNMIQNIFKRTTTHPFIIPFLMDTLLAKERDSTIQCLCKVADSFDSVIVAQYYKRPAGEKAMKCAAWKGDLFTLKKLLDHRSYTVKNSWSELIDLAICRENLNVLEFIVVEKAVTITSNNCKKIGSMGSLPCLQLLLGKTFQAGDFDSPMIRAVHEMACTYGQTKFISDMYNQYSEYNRNYWSNIIHSGIISTAYLQFGINDYNDQEILELIEIAINSGKVEFYQFFVEQLQDSSILNQLSPNKKPNKVSNGLYPIYFHRLLEPRKRQKTNL
ncbi:hypothetical protein PPL_10479 [Heterostelium album PN500]|uniref:Uncharacterized protein n=1 Tax=Heterostelium pallidum (strain ATCC 26659 / Pp 5 / PN500) TaxID=670386 RepID=D3BR75_HETP5|nr:hypothetical protein PPL_10479 [Heterostelium album PN500]EFA75907.1 hypothetical protein PPL_10479 [Heterostelium album PN500]|eukprot:XP_020428041.1 hypothetical protein PPL_10479 [Heterostelium album PN500]